MFGKNSLKFFLVALTSTEVLANTSLQNTEGYSHCYFGDALTSTLDFTRSETSTGSTAAYTKVNLASSTTVKTGDWSYFSLTKTGQKQITYKTGATTTAPRLVDIYNLKDHFTGQCLVKGTPINYSDGNFYIPITLGACGDTEASNWILGPDSETKIQNALTALINSTDKFPDTTTGLNGHQSSNLLRSGLHMMSTDSAGIVTPLRLVSHFNQSGLTGAASVSRLASLVDPFKWADADGINLTCANLIRNSDRFFGNLNDPRNANNRNLPWVAENNLSLHAFATGYRATVATELSKLGPAEAERDAHIISLATNMHNLYKDDPEAAAYYATGVAAAWNPVNQPDLHAAGLKAVREFKALRSHVESTFINNTEFQNAFLAELSKPVLSTVEAGRIRAQAALDMPATFSTSSEIAMSAYGHTDLRRLLGTDSEKKLADALVGKLTNTVQFRLNVNNSNSFLNKFEFFKKRPLLVGAIPKSANLRIAAPYAWAIASIGNKYTGGSVDGKFAVTIELDWAALNPIQWSDGASIMRPYQFLLQVSRAFAGYTVLAPLEGNIGVEAIAHVECARSNCRINSITAPNLILDVDWSSAKLINYTKAQLADLAGKAAMLTSVRLGVRQRLMNVYAILAYKTASTLVGSGLQGVANYAINFIDFYTHNLLGVRTSWTREDIEKILANKDDLIAMMETQMRTLVHSSLAGENADPRILQWREEGRSNDDIVSMIVAEWKESYNSAFLKATFDWFNMKNFVEFNGGLTFVNHEFSTDTPVSSDSKGFGWQRPGYLNFGFSRISAASLQSPWAPKEVGGFFHYFGVTPIRLQSHAWSGVEIGLSQAGSRVIKSGKSALPDGGGGS